jgi:hypothetical protein
VSDGVIVSALVLAVLLGVGSAAFLVMRSPAFWGDVGKELFSKAWPKIWAVLSKRMSEEEEAEWRKAQRQGSSAADQWLKNRMRKRR